MAGSLLLAALFLNLKQVSADSHFPDDPFDYAWSWDGSVLYSDWKETGNRASVMVDKNFNGVYEHLEQYDLHGQLITSYVDVDDNGIPDSVLQWHSSGALIEFWIDPIQLGISTQGQGFDTHGRHVRDYYDLNKDGLPDSLVQYWQCGIQTSDIDVDFDGWFDHTMVLDSTGNLLRTFTNEEFERWLASEE